MPDSLSLSDDFPAANEADWIELVEKALKGRPLDSLNSRTEHGLPVKALYRESGWSSATNAAGFPGFAPFTRGGRADRDQWLPWDIRQIVAHPDPVKAHLEIMEALEHGCSSVELRIDPEGQQGICVRGAQDIKALIAGVDLELASVAVDAVGEASGQSLELAALLAAAVKNEAHAGSRVDFNVDPIGAFVRGAELVEGQDGCLVRAAGAAKQAVANNPAGHFLRVDARAVHEAGGTEVQELAYLAGCGAEYVRALMTAGLSADEACRAILFTVSVGADYHIELAKLRAARRVWGRIAGAFGASETCGMTLQAVSSRRMLSKRDPWVNLLRNTAACFAAGVGGADIVTVRTFVDVLGLPAALARRLARNTQIIAQEESGLGKVIDAPGGSWAFEKIGSDVAEAAWSLFQECEKEGGIIHALIGGSFQKGVADARAARQKAVAYRKEWITGVSDFPAFDEIPPEIETLELDAVLNLAAKPSGLRPEAGWTDLRAAAEAGATLADFRATRGDGTECEPLWPVRLAAPYEKLRDLADARRGAGKAAKIFLAALGPLAEHAARLTYATNFFAAGGIEAVTAAGDASEIVHAFKSSGAALVCLCGTDSRYADEAADAASVLRTAGAGRIYLAGKPGDLEAQLRAAGVEEFIYVGVDVLASLERAHEELAISY